MYTKQEFYDDMANGRSSVEILEYFSEQIEQLSTTKNAFEAAGVDSSCYDGFIDSHTQSIAQAVQLIKAHPKLGCHHLGHLQDLLLLAHEYDLSLDMEDLPYWTWSPKNILSDFGLPSSEVLSWDRDYVLLNHNKLVTLRDAICDLGNPESLRRIPHLSALAGVYNKPRRVR